MDNDCVYESHGYSSEDLRRSGKVTLQTEETRPKSIGFIPSSLFCVLMEVFLPTEFFIYPYTKNTIVNLMYFSNYFK